MDQLITFTSNNTILVVAIVIVSLMLIHSLLGEKLRGYSSVSPAESTQMINHDDALILDVRENNETRPLSHPRQFCCSIVRKFCRSSSFMRARLTSTNWPPPDCAAAARLFTI